MENVTIRVGVTPWPYPSRTKVTSGGIIEPKFLSLSLAESVISEHIEFSEERSLNWLSRFKELRRIL